MTEDIAARIRRAREAAGISARRLDRLSGLAQGHTALIESRTKRRVESATVVKLASALGVSLDWLLAGIGRPPSAKTIRETVAAKTGTDS